MNYYLKIGQMNNKIGYLSALALVFAIVTFGLSFFDTIIFLVGFILFLVCVIMVAINKRKLKQLQQQIFNEFNSLLVSITNQEYVNGIDINTFFNAKGTGNDKKLMVIYDAKLQLDDTQYIKLLLVARKIGFDDVEFAEMVQSEFDVNAYVLEKISSLN